MPVLIEHTKRKAQNHDGICGGREIIWKTTATVCIERIKFVFRERLTEAVNKIFDPPLNYWQERRLVGNMELYAAAWSCNYVHFDRNEEDRSQAAIKCYKEGICTFMTLARTWLKKMPKVHCEMQDLDTYMDMLDSDVQVKSYFEGTFTVLGLKKMLGPMRLTNSTGFDVDGNARF